MPYQYLYACDLEIVGLAAESGDDLGLRIFQVGRAPRESLRSLGQWLDDSLASAGMTPSVSNDIVAWSLVGILDRDRQDFAGLIDW